MCVCVCVCVCMYSKMAAKVSTGSLNVLYGVNLRLYQTAICCFSMWSTDPEYAGYQTLIITVIMGIWAVTLTYFCLSLSDCTYVHTQ